MLSNIQNRVTLLCISIVSSMDIILPLRGKYIDFQFPVHSSPNLCSTVFSLMIYFAWELERIVGTLKSNLVYFLFSFQIILHSMHKYQPRVHVIRKDFSSDLSPTKPVPVGDGVKTFNFPETVFTTVTAYQNQQVRLYCWESSVAYL